MTWKLIDSRAVRTWAANCKTISLSRIPPVPRAPKSVPPCAASSTTMLGVCRCGVCELDPVAGGICPAGAAGDDDGDAVVDGVVADPLCRASVTPSQDQPSCGANR